MAGAIEIQYDSQIDSIVQQVSIDSGFYFTESLSGEKKVEIAGKSDSIPVRHSLTGGIIKATNWLKEQFESRGIEASLQTFTADGAAMRAPRPMPIGVNDVDASLIERALGAVPEQFVFNNVVATIPGKDSRQVILGAHYDATSEIEGIYTPGADDNASGCAAVLEAARIMSVYEWQHTLKFVLFSGEEQGLFGSEYYVKDAVANGDTIIASLIMDMISYNGDEVPQMDLHCCPWNVPSQKMGDTLAALMETYSIDLEPDIHIVDATDRSDHYWFWQEDIPSVLLIEDFDDFTPFYHTTNDRIGSLDADFMNEAMKLVMAWASIEAGLIVDTPTVVAEQNPEPAGDVVMKIPSHIVADQISIMICSTTEVAPVIFDAGGRMVMNLAPLPPSLEIHPVVLDLSDLPRGVYWIRVQGAKATVSEKFVKVH